MRFVDEAQITVRSGKGGHGCVSFRREAHVPKGGPDGGDGGDGGDVAFRASNKLLTLYDFRLKRLYEARNGQPGMGKQCHGKNAENLVIDVPVGTLLYEQDEEGGETLVADLTEEGKVSVVCLGGRGGKGNEHFKSATMRTPRFAQPGEAGQEKHLRLELKILADAGLLGLPSAGKSTFLSRISAARPKIAAYPFTTLVPNLGVLVDEVGEHFVVADLPGLIEGAHEGLGLGHRFLKHVERNRFLLHILSAEEMDFEDPWAGYALLNEELARYSPELAEKPQLEVVNKIDIVAPDDLVALRARAEADGRRVFFISALTGEGVDQLVDVMWTLFRESRDDGADEAEDQ
ncbi:GTPase ObgE [Desulfocurvus sp. DL9XJH121]